MTRGRDTERELFPRSRPDSVDVLHVEDDAAFADLVATFLERERESFAVHTESCPEDALAAVRADETAFDCVVSDYDMPGMNGLALLRELRTERPELPFILFTGKGSEEIASEAITAGVTDYLQKAGGVEQYRVLANRVENAVEGYRAQRYADRSLQAIETARDGIGILDSDGYVVYANSAYASALGYERDELLGTHWEEFYRDEDVDEVYEELLPEARRGHWSGTTTFVRNDGEQIEADHTLTYADDGSLICTLSPSAEGDSGSQEHSVRETAMDEAPVGIVITDPDQEDNPIIYANEEFTELTGYEESEIVGRNCRFLQGEGTSEDAVAVIRNAVAERESATVELKNYRADGTPFWNRLSIAPIFDSAGELDYFVGFQEDVTDQKSDERQLRTTTARLEALFEHSPDMITVHDADGTIQDVNERMCETLGYERNELVGKSVWDLDPSADPERARSFWTDLPTNTPTRFEGRLERCDGTTFPVEVHLIRLDLDGEDRFVAMDRDITERKEREEDLVRQNERLDEFASVVSHDLRNPLQVARGRLELLEEENDSEHIDPIAGALDRMDALIADLLTLAQEGDDAMELEWVSLALHVRECWETAETADAAFVVESDAAVRADRDQLRQLFENLFRNSVEHGSTSNRSLTDDSVEHGTEDGTITVTVGDLEDGFYVADDGTGIPVEERERVFETGFSTSSAGTGFGLTIVERIVESHGWSIRVTESESGGARFEITGVDVRPAGVGDQ